MALAKGCKSPSNGVMIDRHWGVAFDVKKIFANVTSTNSNTVIGQAFVNDTLSLAFLALAAGSILYVVMLLVDVAHRLGFKDLLMWGVLSGMLLGFGTDLVLKAAKV